MKSSAFWVFLYAALITGCATSSSTPVSTSPTPLPETLPEVPAKTHPTTAPWRITPTSQTQSYSARLTTTVIQTDTASIARQDSFKIHTTYSISTLRNADIISFSGSITDFSIESVLNQAREQKPSLPVSFSGTSSNHGMRLEIAISSTQTAMLCEDPSQTLLKTIHRNLIVLPLQLTPGQTWKDSTVSVICSGSLPLNVTSVRISSVIGEAQLNDTKAIVIDQNERTFSKGEGSQGQHRILVEAQGTTTRRFYIDQVSGSLLNSTATSSSSLSIQSSGRNQHFKEFSTEITERLR